MKLWRLPKIEGFILKYRVTPLWPTDTFGKAYGIKVRCYGEHVGEHVENPLGTQREHSGNTLGTMEK
jgi:hypothetical protein